MSATEFRELADARLESLRGLDRADAIAAACRGSGNPVMLAWLAEALELRSGSRVLDLGGGMGGPAAWLTDHYGCTVVVVDPALESCRAARELFGARAVAAGGSALPARPGSFDAVLALGVLSVVRDPGAALSAAARVAPRLGLIVYCATGRRAVHCGGSRFPTRSQLHDQLQRAGWELEAGPSAPGLDPPPAWTEAAETAGDETPDSVESDCTGALAAERAVAEAIADGRVRALVAVAGKFSPSGHECSERG